MRKILVLSHLFAYFASKNLLDAASESLQKARCNLGCKTYLGSAYALFPDGEIGHFYQLGKMRHETPRAKRIRM